MGKFLASIFVVGLTLVLTVLVCNLLLKLYDANLQEAYAAFFRGAWGTKYNISETLSKMSPLLLVSLGFLVSMQAGCINIGGEGQMIFGALGAGLLALFLPSNWSLFVTVPLMVIAGMLGGILWAFPAGYLRTRFGVSEVVMAIMMNEVAAGFLQYLVGGPLKDPTGQMQHSWVFGANWVLPVLVPGTKFHMGVLFSVVATVIVLIMMKKTPLGYSIRAVGLSAKAAKYAGMKVNRVMLVSFLIAGALAGLAGASEAAGIHYRLISEVTSGFGWTAIVVAQLSRKNIAFTPISAFVFASLLLGAEAIQRAVGTPAIMATLLQGVAVFFWIMSEYAVKRVQKHLISKKYRASITVRPLPKNDGA